MKSYFGFLRIFILVLSMGPASRVQAANMNPFKTLETVLHLPRLAWMGLPLNLQRDNKKFEQNLNGNFVDITDTITAQLLMRIYENKEQKPAVIKNIEFSANRNKKSLDLISLDTGISQNFIAIQGQPEPPVWAIGFIIIVGHYRDRYSDPQTRNNFEIIDSRTQEIIGSYEGPITSAPSLIGHFIYVPCYKKIQIFDIERRSIITPIELNHSEPKTAYDTKDGFAFIAAEGENKAVLLKIDTNKHVITESIDLEGARLTSAIVEGNYAFIGIQYSSIIIVADVSKKEIVQRIPMLTSHFSAPEFLGKSLLVMHSGESHSFLSLIKLTRNE